MSEMMVDVGLNLDAGNYIASMGQALNLTKQYSDVATGIPGAVQNLSQSMVKATAAVTGFNKVQTVAVDTAASYEKQLSNVQAKAVLTGQSFDKLAKTTKSWAREFPIGMGEATKIMETLQSQGIKSEKQMESLGKSFIKLGAATGTSASGMGAEFLQLSRTMGNGITQFQKLSDSLVTTTAKIGGSAPSVVAFSKALAPVASTVGMSQTAVLGLSTAMSRLGEDGYQAANSFSKVMLDMNRAMRDGGPELKAYSDLLGVTSEQMKKMFKDNPAEVLAKFSEAVAKQGPNVTRSLDALGFDSVRTTRSLTALARSGQMRGAMETAINAYGNGSTEKAAAEALDGLTDQAARLQETMGQVVQDVGQPMLGFAKALMAPVNAVASGTQAVTGSSAGQAVLGTAGVGGVVAGMAGNVVTAATFTALGKMAWDALKPRVDGMMDKYRAGVTDARTGMTQPRAGSGMAGTLGYARTAGMMSMFGPQAVDPDRRGAGFMRAANRLAGAGMEGVYRYQSATANMFGTLGVPGRMGVTPEMQGLRDDMKSSIRDMGRSARDMNGAGVMGGLRTLGKDIGQYARGYDGGVTPGRFANAAASLAMVPAKATVGMGIMGLRGAGAALGALGSMGISPAMLGIGAAIGGTAYYSGKQQEADQQRDRLMESRTDIYMRFNDFAEATGKAGKGIVAFSENVEKTTKTLVEGNTTWQQAFKVDSDEMAQARAQGYKPVVQAFGSDKSAEALTFAAQTTLGTSATMEDVSRVMMDVANLAGGNTQVIEDVSKNLTKIYGPDASNKRPFDAAANVELISRNSSSFFIPTANDAQTDIGISGMNAAAREGAEAQKLYGGTLEFNGGSIGAEEATRLIRAKELFDSANKDRSLSKSSSKAIQNQLAGLLGMDAKAQQESGLGTGMFDGAMFGMAAREVTSFDEFLAKGGEATKGLSAKYAAMNKAGIAAGPNGAINYGTEMMSSKSPAQVATEGYLASLGNAAGATSNFSKTVDGLNKALFTMSNASIEAGKAMENVTAADVAKVGGNQALATAVQDSGDAKKVQAAVESVMADVIKNADGEFGKAQYALQMTAAEAPATGTERQVLEGVMQQLQGTQAVQQAGRTNAAQLMSQVQTGWQAERAPTTNNTISTNTAVILGGQQAQGQLLSSMADINRAYGGMQAQIGAAQRQAGVAAGGVAGQSAMAQRRAQEDYELQRSYSRQDFRTTRTRAREDYGIARQRATRDFDTSISRMDEDYATTRGRAFEDQAKQVARAYEDQNKMVLRAEADFNKGRARAQRDYNTMTERANRDFNLSQTRATEDYNKSTLRATEDFNKSRGRMIADYNKQISRMVEDSARSMYDPFKRIQAQMVMDAGQLITNLNDQTKAIDKQVENLKKVRDMGLSEQAIKSLNLADASNAQQLSRLVGDLQGNTALVGQVNESVAAKATSAETLTKDTGNVNYARSAEDFATQLSRMDEDFATAQGRSSDDFNTSMARSRADFATQMSDAKADFNKSLADNEADYKTSMDRADADFKTSMERVASDFDTTITRMDADYKKNRDRAFADFAKQMDDMARDFSRQMDRMKEDFDKQALRAADAVKLAVARMQEDAAFQIGQIGASTAASIKGMEESFFGMFQNSDEGIKAAEKFIKIVEGSKIPIKDMSDDMQDMYKAAIALVNGEVPGGNQPKVPHGAAPVNESGKAADTYDESQKMSMKERSRANYSEVGKAAGEGFLSGLGAAIGDLWNNFWQGLYDMVNIKFEIHSPSKKFEEVGKNVILGFVAGISSIPKNLWDKLTDTLPSMDELKTAVVGAFKLGKDWLESFASEDSPIAKWIGKGWEKLWAGVPSAADVMTNVKKAFFGEGGEGGVVGWLKGLAGTGVDTVGGWIGQAWKHITDNMPTFEDVLKKVYKAFGLNDSGEPEKGVSKFFTDLLTTLKTWLPSAESFSTAWTNIFVNPFKTALNAIIDKWNSLSFTFPSEIMGIKVPVIGGKTFSVPKIDRNFAEGGIAMQATRAFIGEAGYPEAVIPLNQRGAEVLAATMARYVDKADVQGSQMERYASPTYNYYSSTQDYSTNFTGSVTVQAQNPDEMAQKLAARARRQRLAQPIGGSR